MIRSAFFDTVRNRPRPDLARSPTSTSSTSPLNFPLASSVSLPTRCDTVHRRRLLRQLDQFAAFRCHQQAVVRLQVSANLTEGCQIVGRVEEQNPAQLRMLHYGDQRRILHFIRQFDGKNHVVKGVVSWRLTRNRASPCVDHYMVGVHSDLTQHGVHQRCFVFAIAVAVRENIRSSVRLPATDAQFDRDIANVVLHERSDGLHLR